MAALSEAQVKAVACGYEHSVAVTHKDVLAWGSNEHGQLGLGEGAPESVPRPYPVKLLHDVMVTQVVCGKFHTICVTAQSQVRAGAGRAQGLGRALGLRGAGAAGAAGAQAVVAQAGPAAVAAAAAPPCCRQGAGRAATAGHWAGLGWAEIWR